MGSGTTIPAGASGWGIGYSASKATWLATSPDATELLGRWIYAPKLSDDRGLI